MSHLENPPWHPTVGRDNVLRSLLIVGSVSAAVMAVIWAASATGWPAVVAAIVAAAVSFSTLALLGLAGSSIVGDIENRWYGDTAVGVSINAQVPDRPASNQVHLFLPGVAGGIECYTAAPFGQKPLDLSYAAAFIREACVFVDLSFTHVHDERVLFDRIHNRLARLRRDHYNGDRVSLVIHALSAGSITADRLIAWLTAKGDLFGIEAVVHIEKALGLTTMRPGQRRTLRALRLFSGGPLWRLIYRYAWKRFMPPIPEVREYCETHDRMDVYDLCRDQLRTLSIDGLLSRRAMLHDSRAFRTGPITPGYLVFQIELTSGDEVVDPLATAKLAVAYYQGTEVRILTVTREEAGPHGALAEYGQAWKDVGLVILHTLNQLGKPEPGQ